MTYGASTQLGVTYGSLLLVSQFEPKEIGRRIKAARLRHGWSQEDFAREASVSLSTAQRWEQGGLPPIRQLYRIAAILEIEISEFVEDPTEVGELPSLREELEEEGRALLETIRKLRAEIETQASDLLQAAQEQREQAVRPGQASRPRRAPGPPS